MPIPCNDTLHIDAPATAEDFAISFQIVTRLDHIRLVRAALCGVLSHLQVAEADSALLAVAVAEILTNAIEHGWMGEETHDLQVRLKMVGTAIEISIEDDGPPAPAAELMGAEAFQNQIEEPTDQWPQRGHGLQIVHSIVDSVATRREQGRNYVLLRKAVALRSTR